MKHPSAYLRWYVNVPKVKHDFRSSGLSNFRYDFNLGEIDFSANYAHGNPQTTELLSEWYHVRPKNVFISGEGASGQNARIVRYLAERGEKRNEAIVEYPTYEPLLRQVQEHYTVVKRLDRKEEEYYRLDADRLRELVSDRTGLLVLTNPHAPSGATASQSELKEVLSVAREYDFHVLCDEIYAEFDRESVPTLYSLEPKLGIVVTSFSKAYGLGGLKLGTTLADKELVDELYVDVLSTVGNSPNIVQLAAAELLAKGRKTLEKHKQKWIRLKAQTERWLKEERLEYFPNKAGVTYWVKLPIKNTYAWMNQYAIPEYSLAAVPGSFFLFSNGYEIVGSNMIRLGLGNIDPDESVLRDSLKALKTAIHSHEAVHVASKGKKN